MAELKTITRSVASGTTSIFPVPFPYLDKTHVFFRLDGVVTTEVEWLSDGEVFFLGGNPPAGTIVERRRLTPDEPLTVFSPGNLGSRDLNVATLQPLFLAQEAGDRAGDLEWLVDALAEETRKRLEGDDTLNSRIDGLMGQFTELLRLANQAADRSKASALESEHHAQVSHKLVEAAVAGFQGFTEGMAYDFGWVSDPMTYFNRDWGSI